MIELIGVEKTYSDSIHALKNININIPAGSICGIIGQSGAGKSTLLRCINLLEKPSAGQVIVAKQNLMQLNSNALRLARRQIGMIFQHFNLLSSLTVYDNIALPLKLINKPAKQINETVTALIKLVQLEDKTTAYPSQLSGGQKQRVAIARALVNQTPVNQTNSEQAPILLCDEATSALDAQTAENILSLLKNLNAKLGITIVLITHTMDVVKAICDQVIVLEAGRVTEQASISDFFSQPHSGISQSFIKSCLKLDLPAPLQQRLLPQPSANSCPIIRIIFQGHAAAEPIIAELINRFHLQLNILQANLDFIQDKLLGIMLLEIQAQQTALEQAMQYLRQKGLHVEIIGYVNSSFI
jgi:D-methionine transport system ATP-binding protein